MSLRCVSLLALDEHSLKSIESLYHNVYDFRRNLLNNLYQHIFIIILLMANANSPRSFILAKFLKLSSNTICFQNACRKFAVYPGSGRLVINLQKTLCRLSHSVTLGSV